MQAIVRDDLVTHHFNNLSAEQGVEHFVTQRDDDSDFTLSLRPNAALGERNREKLCSVLGIAPTNLFIPRQVHGTRIVEIGAGYEDENLADTDALITRQPNKCLAVLSADCVPILLYDRKHHAIGAVHSGWRGTVAKILEKTLNAMEEAFGTKGSDVRAGIGPSVSQFNYEVGREVVKAAEDTFGLESDILEYKSDGKGHLDLWQANKLQLLSFGVPEDQIEISNLCTVHHNRLFFSARKGDTGRFAAGIMLQNVKS